jgi:hypothetical protein
MNGSSTESMLYTSKDDTISQYRSCSLVKYIYRRVCVCPIRVYKLMLMRSLHKVYKINAQWGISVCLCESFGFL